MLAVLVTRARFRKVIRQSEGLGVSIAQQAWQTVRSAGGPARRESSFMTRARDPRLKASSGPRWLRWLGVFSCVAAASVSACVTSVGEDEEGTSPSQPGPADFGAGSLHRLNRTEYSNTLRDLLGEPLRLGDKLPADETNALGYDNDGGSLATSPLLVERWVDSAERAIESYFARQTPIAMEFPILAQPCEDVRPGLDACGQSNGQIDADNDYYGMRSNEEVVIVTGFVIPADGHYTVHVSAYSTPVIKMTEAEGPTEVGEPLPVQISLAVDGVVKSFDVTDVPKDTPRSLEYEVELTRGKHVIELRSVRDDLNKNVDGSWYEHTAWIHGFGITGPGKVSADADGPALVDCDVVEPECVRDVLQRFATRAWRREVAGDEIDPLVAIAQLADAQGDGDAAAKALAGLKLALRAVLVSPHFLYRPELGTAQADGVTPLDDYELASRLSYFLWSTMPDQELFDLAREGTLSSSDELGRQVDRMLADPKSQALVDDFAGQWLNLRRVEHVSLLPDQFPDFTPSVKAAMREETELFFSEFLTTDRSFLELVDANFTFANQELATYYGLDAEGLGDEFERVSLEGSNRTGLLSQGTFLTTTSHPNRTSPVMRGKFVLKQLLCSSPPAPPANVPPFNEDVSAGTVRERLEQHRAGECASCHIRMDAVGFALENFDATARYRTTDDGGQDLDTSDLSLDDVAISDVASLATAVREHDRFVPCVVRQLYSYAIGRQATTDDNAMLTMLEEGTRDDGYVLSGLIHRIVSSNAFRTKPEAKP